MPATAPVAAAAQPRISRSITSSRSPRPARTISRTSSCSVATAMVLAVAKEVNQEVENKPGPSNGRKHHKRNLQNGPTHGERLSDG